MARTDTEQLVVALEARIAQFEKNFAKANATAQKNFGAVERRSQQASQRINRHMTSATAGVTGFANSLKGLAAGFGVGFGVVGLQRLVTDSLSAADAIAKMSETADVSSSFLQEMRFAASQSGIEARGLDDSMRRLTRRVGLFISEGGGPAEKALERLGLASRITSGELRGTEPIFNEIVTALQGVESQAERSALAAQLFGDDFGPKLLPLLNQGIDGISKLRAEAQRLGIVMDDELIKKSVEANDALDRMSFVIGTSLTVAVAEAAPAITAFAEEAIARFRTTRQEIEAVVGAVRDLIHWLGGVPDTSLDALVPPDVARRVREMREAASTPLEVDIRQAAGFEPPASAGGTPRIIPPSPSKRSLLADPFTTSLGDEEAERKLALLRAHNKLVDEGTDKTEELTAAQIAAANAGQQFALTVSQGLTSAITGATSFKDAVTGIIQQLAEAIIQAIIFRSITAAFGGAFGAGAAGGGGTGFAGGFASGGTIPAGKWGVVGERGPELISGPARITPMAGGMGSLAVNTSITVNVEGGSQGQEADQELANKIGTEMQAVIDSRITSVLKDQLRPGNLLNQSRTSL